MASLDFSAVLLAGGKSTRMGRDKAMLPWGEGRVLWEVQLEKLRALAPGEIFWSGLERPSLPANLLRVHDPEPDCGPMAGILAALRICRTPLLVVLAIDLPYLPARYLRSLLTIAQPDCGVAPHFCETYEPLAAIYPKALLPLLEQRWSEKKYALQGLLRETQAKGLLFAHSIGADESPFFRNLNSEADL